MASNGTVPRLLWIAIISKYTCCYHAMHVTYSESQLIVFPKTTSLLPLVFQKLNLWPFPSLVSCTSLYIRATFCSFPHSFTIQKSYLSTTLRLFCSVILKQDMSSSGIRVFKDCQILINDSVEHCQIIFVFFSFFLPTSIYMLI